MSSCKSQAKQTQYRCHRNGKLVVTLTLIQIVFWYDSTCLHLDLVILCFSIVHLEIRSLRPAHTTHGIYSSRFPGSKKTTTTRVIAVVGCCVIKAVHVRFLAVRQMKPILNKALFKNWPKWKRIWFCLAVSQHRNMSFCWSHTWVLLNSLVWTDFQNLTPTGHHIGIWQGVTGLQAS